MFMFMKGRANATIVTEKTAHLYILKNNIYDTKTAAK